MSFESQQKQQYEGEYHQVLSNVCKWPEKYRDDLLNYLVSLKGQITFKEDTIQTTQHGD